MNFNCINEHLDLPFHLALGVLVVVENERKAAVNTEKRAKKEKEVFPVDRGLKDTRFNLRKS